MSVLEEGNVSILAMASMATLAMTLMFALEFACAYVQKLSLDNDLNIAREETLSAGFDMQLKNSANPGALIAASIAESLDRNGFAGEATVWFYEVTDSELHQASPQLKSVKNVRALAYFVSLSQERSSVILPDQWLKNFKLKSGTAAAICPYALYETYKPAGIAGRLVKYQAHQGEIGEAVELPLESAPEKLAAAIARSVDKATETATSNQ